MMRYCFPIPKPTHILRLWLMDRRFVNFSNSDYNVCASHANRYRVRPILNSMSYMNNNSGVCFVIAREHLMIFTITSFHRTSPILALIEPRIERAEKFNNKELHPPTFQNVPTRKTNVRPFSLSTAKRKSYLARIKSGMPVHYIATKLGEMQNLVSLRVNDLHLSYLELRKFDQ